QGVDVVCGAPGGGESAAGPAAALVAGGQGAAQGGGLGAVAAADGEGGPVFPADQGDLGPAGEGEDLAGGEQGAVGRPCRSWVRAGCVAGPAGLGGAGLGVEEDGEVGH